MKRATLIAAALAIFSVSGGAQTPVPSTPPAQPVEPSPPARTPTPPERARKVQPLEFELPDFSDLNERLEDMKMNLELAPTPEMMDLDLAPMHDMMDIDLAPSFLDMDRVMDVAPPTPDFDFNFDFDMPDMPDMPEMPEMPDMAPMMPMEPMPMEPIRIEPMDIPPVMAMAPLKPLRLDSWSRAADIAPVVAAMDGARAALNRVPGQSPFERQFGNIASEPQAAWAQSDPADSLYRLARETLNRGEYRRASQLFGDISQRFPNSVYAADARYWRAFALYRIGGTADLRDALTALQDKGRPYRQASLQADAAALAARIRAALAAQGDPQAREQLGRVASDHSETCDKEDLAVRIEALTSLGQTDPESTTPILRRLLARRDECSTSLRRAALWLLGKRTDPEAMSLVMNTARTDPDTRVRAEALRFLAAMPGDQAVSTLEEIARTPGNEQLQRAAILALGRSDSPRAHQSIRTIIERTDLDEDLRATALSSVDAEHTSDNGAYVRSVYPRLNSPRLKAAAIRAAASIGGPENDQWLLSVVRNTNEPADVRAMALRYAGRSSIPMADLARMYDVADARPLREQLVRLYAQRAEPEATDKLLDIARTGTDPDMRRLAISALSRKNDPRTKKLLLEIIDK
jgi:HEAT repeat protein